MNQSTLSRQANPKTKYDLARPGANSQGQRNLENPNQVWPIKVLAEVEKLKRALAESRSNEKIRLREIKTLTVRNLKLSQKLALLTQKESKARHIAYHDELTGLPNRRLLQDRLKQAVAQAARHDKQVAVMLLDLDGFKSINDRLGHPVGDQLLQQVAKRLSDCVRVADTVCRYGGDEFVVMLPEFEDGDTAAAVAEKIRAQLETPYVLGSELITVRASIGVAEYPDDGSSYRALIKHADSAMYRAKTNNFP
jgi:diguanylate cyclase